MNRTAWGVRISARFLKDSGGNFAILFGLCAFLLIGLVGFAVDYSLRVRLDDRIQAAADAAVLAAVKEIRLDPATREQVAQRMFDFNVGEVKNVTFENPTLLVETSPPRVVYSVDYRFTPFFGAFYSDSLRTGSASATARPAFDPLDVSLVLDTTGSMRRGSKLTELKAATTLFMDAFVDTGDAVQVAIVPFGSQVRVETGEVPQAAFALSVNPYKAGLDCASVVDALDRANCVAGGSYPRPSKAEGVTTPNSDLLVVDPSTWRGCVVDRPQPYDTMIEAPDPAHPETLYPMANCGNPGMMAIRPLSSDHPAAKAYIARMAASGTTNVGIGVQWGLEALSANEPLTGARSDRRVQKLMIVLTDGDNTLNRWGSNRTAMDERTALACQNAKDAAITVYAIRLIEGNADLLRRCATSPDHFFDVKTASDLTATFMEISERIRRVVLVN